MITVSLRRSGLDIRVLGGKVGKEMRAKLVQMLTDHAYELMSQKAPVRTGALRASITKTVSATKGSVEPTVPYAVYVSEGTRPHEIRPVNASCLAFNTLGGFVFTRLVRHPGTRPNPYIAEAFAIVEQEVEDVWNQIWSEEVGA
ncbi:HK97 gp10 family phage protein [Candidatus Bathyarchaeota archaeon]|nr:HK97 gp10 family phage protein [Candidatus Bathyarchaeota archaeon]